MPLGYGSMTPKSSRTRQQGVSGMSQSINQQNTPAAPPPPAQTNAFKAPETTKFKAQAAPTTSPSPLPPATAPKNTSLGTPYGTTGPAQSPTDQMFQDLMAQHEANWADKEAMARNQGALAQRQAAEKAARLGAAVSGGTMAAGVGQAQLAGNQAMLQAKTEQDKQSEELYMTYLQQLMSQAEAAKDRAAQERIQSMIDSANLQRTVLENS